MEKYVFFVFILSDVDQIENGIGDKLALLFQYLSTFIAGFIIGFVYGWELTLVILSVSPLLAIAGGVMGKVGSYRTVGVFKPDHVIQDSRNKHV